MSSSLGGLCGLLHGLLFVTWRDISYVKAATSKFFPFFCEQAQRAHLSESESLSQLIFIPPPPTTPPWLFSNFVFNFVRA